MREKQWITLLGHFILLQLLWPVAVLGAVQGWRWESALVVAAMPVWTALRRLPVRRDLRMLFSGLAIGVVFELVLVGLGLIEYRLTPGPGLVPLWILMLWAGFALNFNHCLAWLQGRWWLGAGLGAFGGPASVLVGASLGAASLPAGVLPLVVFYGGCWALVVPLLGWLARYYHEHESGVPA